MSYREAARIVDESGLPDRQPIFAYLSGFNALMSGEVGRAEQRLNQLDRSGDAQTAPLRGALGGMVRRADALRAAGVDLGTHSLTAWHAIINGSLLLHESPHGFEDAMRGRYAYASDSPGLMHEGLARLVRLLSELDIRPARVIRAPDRASSILAGALGTLMDVPVVDYTLLPQPGVVVAWNLEEVGSQEVLSALATHRPGELLFAHASGWVDPFPYSPDVTTMLGQTITHPYLGGALRVDPVTQDVVQAEPDTREERELIAEILGASVDEGSRTPIEHVLRIARALSSLSEEDRLGVGRTSGARLIQRAGSPVASNRFT